MSATPPARCLRCRPGRWGCARHSSVFSVNATSAAERYSRLTGRNDGRRALVS